MYVAVKGGERAILNSYRMLDDYRRGDRALPELSLDQIREPVSYTHLDVYKRQAGRSTSASSQVP